MNFTSTFPASIASNNSTLSRLALSSRGFDGLAAGTSGVAAGESELENTIIVDKKSALAKRTK
jgi:hypothetical protein